MIEVSKNLSGDTRWYLNGELHREDGPAIVCDDGHKEWYLNGQKLTEEEYNQKEIK